MKLTTARLCLDCDEVHGEPQCPVCGSESFAFLTRWVDPGGERPAARPAEAVVPADPERLKAYRKWTATGTARRAGAGRRLFGAAAGLLTLSVTGWIWSASRSAAQPPTPVPPAPDPPPPDGDA